MTRDKDFKRLVRARASEAGERYTTARMALLRHRKEARMVPVTCEVTTRKVTEEQRLAVEERQRAAAEPLLEKYPNVRIATLAGMSSRCSY